jgi:hypothetical protein
VAVPNFKRWEAYLDGIEAATSLPIVVWQIPEGNQVAAIENNTHPVRLGGRPARSSHWLARRAPVSSRDHAGRTSHEEDGVVEPRGFEPLTSAMQRRRSPN